MVVTINYRLGPLGYFAHPALTAAARKDEPLANYGLMDQIAALQWVKRNIEAFGGDPRQVTVFGESAGGMSTLALLATPSTKGLYARAIVQSGGGWFPPTTLAARAQAGEEALAALGHAKASAADLRALPAESLVGGVGGSFGPFPDGRLLKETPSQAFAAGRAADVPLIIGWNSGEDSLMGPWRPEMIRAVPETLLRCTPTPPLLLLHLAGKRNFLSTTLFPLPGNGIVRTSTATPSSYEASRDRSRSSHPNNTARARGSWRKRCPAPEIMRNSADPCA